MSHKRVDSARVHGGHKVKRRDKVRHLASSTDFTVNGIYQHFDGSNRVTLIPSDGQAPELLLGRPYGVGATGCAKLDAEGKPMLHKAGEYLPLGTRIVTDQMLDRHGRTQVRWLRVPNAFEGIIVGVRTVFDGSVTNDSDYGTYFTQSKAHRVYLVAHSLFHIPVHVPLDAVKAVSA